jgi:hypothetical protein
VDFSAEISRFFSFSSLSLDAEERTKELRNAQDKHESLKGFILWVCFMATLGINQDNI